MKYRKLPFEIELEGLRANQGQEAMERFRSASFLETIKTPGFQLVTGILRNRELVILDALRSSALSAEQTARLGGGLHTIQVIRDALTSLLPVGQHASVDFFDDEEEAWSAPPDADGNGRMET